MRRSDKNNPTDAKEYIPCIYCLGFLQKDQAYKHAKNCTLKKKEFSHVSYNRIVKEGSALLHSVTSTDSSTDEWLQIKSKFRDDEVGTFAKNDATMYAWCNSLTRKYGLTHSKYIRDKLRIMGTLVTAYHAKYGTNITDDISLKEILQTKNFKKIYDVTKTAYGTSLTPAVKVGSYIKDVLVIIKQEAIFSNDTKKKKEIDNLLYLVNTEWNHISIPNIRKLKELRPVVVAMPVTSDIKSLLEFLSIKIKNYVNDLSAMITFDVWMKLSKCVHAFLIIFNRRWVGEVSKLKLETYTNMPDYDDMETDVFMQTLTPIEKYLCKNFYYMTTIGKRNRKVPIVYSQNIKVALEILVDNRQTCGIQTTNPYLFPNTALLCNRGHDVIRDLVNECRDTCELKKTDLLTSTRLRKHVATVAQIMVLNTGELGHLQHHMGHTGTVHNKFYRQNESTIEKTHITKLLQVVNSGTITKYKNKTLAEISLEDVITAATDDVNNETIDDDDDDDDVDDLDDDSNEEVNVSIVNEVVSEPPPPTSKQSLHEKPKDTLISTSRLKPKLSRFVWPDHVKHAIRAELGDCIQNIKNLNSERVTAFLEKYSLQHQSYSNFRNVVYNMGRPKRQ